MDALSPEERELIDAAVEAGRVRVMPPRTFSGTDDLVYDSEANKLRYADKKASEKWRRYPGKEKSPRVAARRERVAALARSGKTVREIVAETGLSDPIVRDDLKAAGVEIVRERRAPKCRAKPAAGAEAPVAPPKPPAAAPAPPASVDTHVQQETDAKPPRRRRPGRNGAADMVRAERAARGAAEVADRRRFKVVPVPMGNPSILAQEGATGTIFPSRVFDVEMRENVLKDGANNSKIGGDVLVGHLKGARIFTLTLEERATCPATCRHWLSCYGNSMQHARRWRHGPELIEAVELELSDLCQAHERILVRLHVLGDFWSTEYVDFWRKMLGRYPGLNVFGFTAHLCGSPIGDAVAQLRDDEPRRFWVRHSDVTGPWGSFTVDFPTSQKTIGDAVVCPEQRDGMEGSRRGVHCGSCGICWSSNRPIAFVVH